jgi:hypothetical protein
VPKNNPQSPGYIALDTNVLLDRVEKDEDVLDCLSTIAERVGDPCIAILPTVIQELQDLSELTGPTKGCPNWQAVRDLAGQALDNILHWGYRPLPFLPVLSEIVEETAQRIREKAIIPYDEKNDARIIAEAAALPAIALISSDNHIYDCDKDALNLELASAHLTPIAIYSPRQIIKRFFRPR